MGNVIGGSVHSEIKAFVIDYCDDEWHDYRKGKDRWQYMDLWDKHGSWDIYRRMIYFRYICDEKGQRCFEFFRPDRVIYTNLETDERIDDMFQNAGL
ncbi:hypothetical protein JW979_04260 [bacterium]|nr:hypothetical protein [candidate division CSSED10-310 bacterium]